MYHSIEKAKMGLIKVFIVEDDTMFGELIKMKLEENHLLDVMLFTSGEGMFREFHMQPDIVILDYFLPYKNGVQIIKELKELSDEVSVILLSVQKMSRS